jgi:alanine racemase
MFCPVVKADGYGHGLDLIAPVAVHAGAHYLGITENDEAKTVRGLGLSIPLLRLRPATVEEIADGIGLGVEEVVGSYEAAQRISGLGVSRRVRIPVHIGLDIGMSRMSFSFPAQSASIRKAMKLKGIRVVGVLGHYPCADENEETVTRSQTLLFKEGLAGIGVDASMLRHAANSAAVLTLPETLFDMVRLGVATYGAAPSSIVNLPDGIKPVMSWVTKVVEVRDVPEGTTIGYGMTFRTERDSRIATLPVGYADGYLRAFSNQADVLIHGQRCPVVGRVSMNMVTVDVTDLDNVSVGAEVYLLGGEGESRISVEELASCAHTISYEVLCLAGRCNQRAAIQ